MGIWLAGVVLLNVHAAKQTQRREAFRQLKAEVKALAENAGGSVDWYRADQPITASLHTANDDQVQNFLGRLIGSDARLEWLHLSGCDIDDSRLAQIGEGKHLVGLKVNDTNVTGRQFSELADLSIVRLELQRLDLRQADWMGLNREKLTSSAVGGSQISQTEFVEFLKTTRLVELDAGGLEIADELQDAICDQTEMRLKRLGLRGSDIDDQFVRRLKAGGVVRLDLAGTEVTDAAMDSLTAMMPKLTHLDLSNTAVTDAGVAELAAHWPSTAPTAAVAFGSSLHLANTDVTGEFLVDWGAALPKQLDLSGTKITDTLLDSLPDSFSVVRLDLSRTQITDAILVKLAQKNVPYVVIADTGIFGGALIQADTAAAKLGLGAGVQEWFVNPGQLTGKEMIQFAKAGVTVRGWEQSGPPP